jgi:hypothetical protein
MLEHIAAVRAEHIPDYRLPVRQAGEAEARSLLADRAGRFTVDDFTQFARAAGADQGPRSARPSTGRWGPGLAQMQINNWVARIDVTNRAIADLWAASPADTYETYERLRAAGTPGGGMLSSLILYLRDPENYCVHISSLERGASALGIFTPVSNRYEPFNRAVQSWRQRFGIAPAEVDIVLTVGDPQRDQETDTAGLSAAGERSLQASFEEILGRYVEARETETFGKNSTMAREFERLRNALTRNQEVIRHPTLSVQASVGVGNWNYVPWIGVLDSRAAQSIREGVYCVYLFRRDMTGMYLTLNQGVTGPRKRLGWPAAKIELQSVANNIRKACASLSASGFRLDPEIDLRSGGGLGADYEISTIAHKLYERGQVPADEDLVVDLSAALGAYEDYVDATSGKATPPLRTSERTEIKSPQGSGPSLDRKSLFQSLAEAIDASTFVFEPWQLAAYVTSVRTKPFVILAGVSGTGKSRLPVLVAEATAGRSHLVAVRPDWTDSSEVLGYADIEGTFRPGRLLTLAAEVKREPAVQNTFILDEMNLARVEHYFAEVLSALEDRTRVPGGGYESAVLMPQAGRSGDTDWSKVRVPPNLAIVGTVNMDETTQGFSRKVIDRAFTLELSDVDLAQWRSQAAPVASGPAWPASAWYPRGTRLGEVGDLSDGERESVTRVVEALTAANVHLADAQLQLGYRTRDEIALFVLHAADITDFFATRIGEQVEPLDLAIHMKVLPRLAGGTGAIRRCLDGLLGWAMSGSDEGLADAEPTIRDWVSAGRPPSIADAKYPRTAARLCLMRERLDDEGFTSFWL